MRVYLAIKRCPHGLHAIAIERESGSSSYRLTDLSCCGRWNDVTRMPINPKLVADVVCGYVTESAKGGAK